ncbi:MAG: hypothetical protein ACLQHT_01530 [Terracidiphilus sp.]
MISPIVVALIAVAAIWTFCRPRKYAAFPMLLLSLLVPLGQGLVLGPFHVPVYRIMILIGWMRVLQGKLTADKDFKGLKLHSLDWAIIISGIVASITFCMLYGWMDSTVNRLGFLYTSWGSYFLFRVLVRTNEDVDRLIKTLAFICIVLAVLMVREQMTGQNFFGYLGGVPLANAVREGRLRSQGPFRHPILAGTFSATVAPLFARLWVRRRAVRSLAIVGAVSAVVVTVTSASSTPLLALVAGAFGLVLWPVRRNMRLLRWMIVFTLVALHMVMRAPVWALINHIDIVGGSSGFHRFALIDQTIRHFSDWWLYGIQDSGVWGWEMWDTSNTYVDVAVQGGIASLLTFIALLVYGFKMIGLSRKRVETYDRRGAFALWALGCALLANVVAFIGITYFDQNIVMWHVLLAMIVTAASIRQPPITRECEGTKPDLAIGTTEGCIAGHQGLSAF